jgi:hypothetical protein
MWEDLDMSEQRGRAMSKITQRDYWNEVKDCARAVKEENEDLDQLVAQHSWIIYTWANLQILVHSKSENAYFEEFGEKLQTEDFASTVQVLAYWAFKADIQEEISK